MSSPFAQLLISGGFPMPPKRIRPSIDAAQSVLDGKGRRGSSAEFRTKGIEPHRRIILTVKGLATRIDCGAACRSFPTDGQMRVPIKLSLEIQYQARPLGLFMRQHLRPTRAVNNASAPEIGRHPKSAPVGWRARLLKRYAKKIFRQTLQAVPNQLN